ncbi:hypothetical protein GUJ93_ZPchr0009g143 [Zizania palustris]|uniref:BHLH domain-containing protein n=1 Tax=Zizania palustris TaxID=103762 RepID=A0A8J5RN84_ZIZPA|nr:hypothetical protein GUJ93_ZPchr0009g143 [Zizania palustris]
MSRQEAAGPAGAGQFIAAADYSGEPATAAADNFSDDMMLRDDDNFDFSSDNLFELMCQGGGRPDAGLEQPPVMSSCLRLSPAPAPAPAPPSPDHHHHSYYAAAAAAPSEEEMAAWLYVIVSGDDGGDNFAGHQLRRPEADDGRREALPEKTSTEDRARELRELIKDTAIDDSCEKKTLPSAAGAGAGAGAGSRTRHLHSAGVHNLTEKRRRLKITEKLKTLQQLVPGCDKTDQASTLDQTIMYMKSLQDQVNTMSVVGSGMAPGPQPAMYPQYLPPTTPTPTMPLALGLVLAAVPPPTMAPFGAMLPYPHYPAVLLPPPATLYRPAAAATAQSVARAAGGGGSHRRHGSSSGCRSKSSSSHQLRQIH